MTEIDPAYMKLALRLAARGAGWVSPNPMVGAVVVKDGQVVGRGYHRRAGLPHAEVEALRAAGEAARGADLYVTLEPCNHQGRTPPCTHAILAAGVRRVVIGSRDPNPQVAGGGAEFLTAQGVDVAEGVLTAEARRLNEAWFHYVTTGRPWVMAKAACSLDGKIATVGGESQWLTGQAARGLGHRLRHRVDAIVVGIGTVLADDPQLTTRLPRGPSQDPIRIVLDSRLRLPLTSRLLNLNSEAPTWVATTGQAPPEDPGHQGAGGPGPGLPGTPGSGIPLTALLEHLGAARFKASWWKAGPKPWGLFSTRVWSISFIFFSPPNSWEAREPRESWGVRESRSSGRPPGSGIGRSAAWRGFI